MVTFTANSETAIARGALIAGLNRQGKLGRRDDGGPNICGADVVSRVAGRHYGIWGYADFRPGFHPEELREINGDPTNAVLVGLTYNRVARPDGDKVKEMRWFAKKV